MHKKICENNNIYVKYVKIIIYKKQRYAIIKASNDEREEKKCYKQLKT